MPMNAETHSQLANFIWSICNLLRGPYKRNEYRKVILPLTVLRRFDCLLAPTKVQVLKEHAAIKGKPENVVRSLLEKVTTRPFYNLSKMDFTKLLDDPNQLAPNLNAYINGFSKNVRDIMERFAFDQQIARMAEKNLLYEVIKAFSRVDLSPDRVDNVQMGYVFEELIRIGAEQANEEAGEHFTPREVIRLMVNLLLSPEREPKAYEAYIFGLCLRAVRELGVTPVLRGINGTPAPFIFRGAPGQIYSKAKNYGYAEFTLNGWNFEIHAGVEFQGARMTHELDVCIMNAGEAIQCSPTAR